MEYQTVTRPRSRRRPQIRVWPRNRPRVRPGIRSGTRPGTEPSPQRGKRRAAALILGTLLIAGVTATPVEGPAAPANALENHHGPGVNWGNGVHIYGAGAFIIDGAYVYCVEPWIRSGSAIPDFVRTDTIPGNSSDGVSVTPTSGAPLRQINFLIERYGQTGDDLQAAAVALAIWEIRGADGRANAGYAGEVEKVHRSVGPEVVALAQHFMAEAAWWLQPSSATVNASDAPELTLHPEQPSGGTVLVPTGTRSLTIENGVFSDGTSTRSWDGVGAPPGTSLSWRGVPPATGWDRFLRVTFSGSYLSIPDTVLWGNGNGWQSSIVSGTPEVKPLRATHADIDTSWAPQVSSEVSSRFVNVGERHSDEVIFAAGPAAAPGTSGEWRWRVGRDGAREWMPVKARVTAYGPFLTDPALNPSPEPPVGAPVAARATLSTDPNRDHSTPQRYSFVFDEPILEPGYYSYKWDIVGDDQDPAITGADDCTEPNPTRGCRVLPTSYFFSDGFGAARETQVGRMQARFATKLSAHEVPLGGTFSDEIALSEVQNWLRDDDGARLPLTLTGTAYLVRGEHLVQSVSVPSDAVPLTTLRVTSDPSQSGQRLSSETVSIPVDISRDTGYVTMRWCVVDEDQDPRARGFWEEGCDDFGVPAESARIARPEVRTEAMPLATIHDGLTDTAVVDGPVPEHTELVFELFKQPVAEDPKRGAEGETAAAQWTKEEVDALGEDAICSVENRVARTASTPVAAGRNDGARYDSPEMRVEQAGRYWWVESLIHREAGTETVLHRGLCGLPNETTEVAEPQVATKASTSVQVGEPAHDTAVVTGPLPAADSGVRAELTFQVFERRGGTASCEASDLVFDLDEPVPVAEAGEYVSGEVSFKAPGDYFWVETLSYLLADGSRQIVHTGACGLPEETTRVQERPMLASTGAERGLSMLGWLGLSAGGGLLWMGLGLLMFGRRRRPRSVGSRTKTRIRECSG